MIDASDVVVWINENTKQVRITSHRDDIRRGPRGRDDSDWDTPIGACYLEWPKMTLADRRVLLTETAIDLAMQGYDLGHVLRAFAGINEFRALGGRSYPMCRALTSALVGKCMDPIGMSFEELLDKHGPVRMADWGLVESGDLSARHQGRSLKRASRFFSWCVWTRMRAFPVIFRNAFKGRGH